MLITEELMAKRLRAGRGEEQRSMAIASGQTADRTCRFGTIERNPAWIRMAAAAVLIWSICAVGVAQIGGRAGADGPVMIDDVEDLDMLAGGVQRAWVPQVTGGNSFDPVPPTSGGLTLAAGQTPLGAFAYKMKVSSGYLNLSFGVPVPSVAGQSTADYPGDMTSFSKLSFLTRSSNAITSQTFQVILETYPGPPYPKLYYKYSLTPGTTYRKIEIDLHAPDFVENAGGRTVEELLSKTRYLAFYYFGGPDQVVKSLTVHVDDICLIPSMKNESCVRDWAIYD